eukprot:TRINITY_DN1807_c0_g1_i11.p2 TRINITY_DN1807_c0_g1~~TRINITY_DN1807_c0_g1_i11.p2  ORF type:complete len:226 (-),score=70.44 TRINITY_DN1807_c0_g1_i11:269-946(-)
MKSFSLIEHHSHENLLETSPVFNTQRNAAEELQEFALAASFVKEVLRSEDVIQVGIKLDFSSLDDDNIYHISVYYKNSNYTIDKTLDEINGLQSHLKYLFPSIRLPEVTEISTEPSSEPDSKVGKVAEWLLMVLNDVALMCTDMRRFFGFDFMKVFDWVYKLRLETSNGNLQRLKEQLNPVMAAEVPLYKLEIENELNLVFRIKLVMKFDFKLSSWEIDKKYIRI